MILSFKERFVPLIQVGEKIHTIRQDKHNRWKPGMKIHFWHSNPRNVKGHPYPFHIDGDEVCVSTQEIIIEYSEEDQYYYNVKVDGRMLADVEIHALGNNDGLLGIRGLLTWFNEPFKGKIIHWTDKKY